MIKFFLFILFQFIMINKLSATEDVIETNPDKILWLGNNGNTPKSIVQVKDIVTEGEGMKINVGTINLGGIDLSSKFNCETGELDIAGGLDSFINQFLQMFSKGSLKTLLDQMSYQAQIEIIINLMAKIHYLVMKNGFDLSKFKEMFDAGAMKSCIETKMKSAFDGSAVVGFGTAKEDMIQLDLGIDFVELIGLASCFDINIGQEVDEDQWEKSYKWANELLYAILELAMGLNESPQKLKLDLKCEKLMENISKNKVITSRDNIFFLDSVMKRVESKAMQHKEVLTKQYDKTMERMFNQVEIGNKSNKLGNNSKVTIEGTEYLVGMTPTEKNLKTDAEIAKAEEDAKAKKEKKGAKKGAKKAELKGSKAIKDVHFEITYKSESNNQIIDIYQPQPEQYYDIYEHLFNELLVDNIYKNDREKELYYYLLKKVFALKKISRINANQMIKIKDIIKAKAKEQEVDTASNSSVLSFCTPTGSDFSVFDQTDEKEKIIFSFLDEIIKKSIDKYNYSGIKITKKEELNIINKAKREDTTGKEYFDNNYIAKEIVKLQYEKLNYLNYKSLHYRDGRAIYVKIKDWLGKRDGKIATLKKDEANINTDNSTNFIFMEAQKDLYKNTLIGLCLQALDEEKSLTFTGTVLEEPMIDYQSLMLDNMELLDTIRVLYEIENPGKMNMFVSKGKSNTNSTQLFAAPSSRLSNYEIPDKIMYSQALNYLEGVSLKDKLFLIKTAKFIKRKAAILLMKIHGNMYAQINADSQVDNNKFNNVTHQLNNMYEIEVLKHNMLKRQLMLQLLLDKR